MTTPKEPRKYLRASEGGKIHAARVKNIHGDVTGKLIGSYYVAACSGRGLGGAWGSTAFDELPGVTSIGANALCARCFPSGEPT